MGIEYKLIAGGILALILGCAAYFGLHQVYAAGEAHTQLAWDKDRIAIQAAADKQIAQLAAERDMAVRANEGITNDLQAQIIAARASADAYATSLRDTRTRLAALSSQMPKAANNASPATGAAPPSVGQLDAATGAALAECAEVRADYKGLIAELRVQL